MTATLSKPAVSIRQPRAPRPAREPGHGVWRGEDYWVDCSTCPRGPWVFSGSSDVAEPYVCDACRDIAESLSTLAESVAVRRMAAREALAFVALLARRLGRYDLAAVAAEGLAPVDAHAAELWPRLRAEAKRARVAARTLPESDAVLAALSLADVTSAAAIACVRLLRARRAEAIEEAARAA